MTWVYLDGRLLREGEATVPATAAAVLTGRGVFETFRLQRDRCVFRFDRHLARLADGARTLGIHLAATADEFAGAATALAKRNDLEDARIRLTLLATDGRSSGGSDGTIVMQARAATDYPDKMYRQGVSAIISTARRDETSPLAGIKSTNLLASDLTRAEARAEGAFEAILLSTQGAVAEGSMTNLFIVRAGHILTPPVGDGALPGITRQAIIDLARKASLPIAERSFGPGDLSAADEAFLTNAVAGVLPLVRINDAPIGTGTPGLVTQAVRALYTTAVERETRD